MASSTKQASRQAVETVLDLSKIDLSSIEGKDKLPKGTTVFETRVRAPSIRREEDAAFDLAVQIDEPFTMDNLYGKKGDFLVQHDRELIIVGNKEFRRGYETADLWPFIHNIIRW